MKKRSLIIGLIVVFLVFVAGSFIIYKFFFVVPEGFIITWVREGYAWGFVHEEIVIEPNGQIKWTDKVNNKTSYGELSNNELLSLSRLIKDADFYSLKEKYCFHCEDCPDNLITIKKENKINTVRITAECYPIEEFQMMPDSLYNLLETLEDYYARKIDWNLEQ